MKLLQLNTLVAFLWFWGLQLCKIVIFTIFVLLCLINLTYKLQINLFWLKQLLSILVFDNFY